MRYLMPLLLCVMLVSCGGENNSENTEPIDYRQQNDSDIQAYIKTNNIEAQKSDSGLYYAIEEAGNGTRPTTTSDVTVAYKGYFLNQKVFDQSDENGITFNLQQVIKGWTEGITYFNEGGKGLLLIPAHLGYGSFDSYGIPGGSVLIFEIDLISVN
ncbi:FKBP-type peptidyl-prolyl cis-trans isomerase [Pareuzebyella sediminis]|uniref:FKBP-type peptidyl-prolyl cis-trans isomerase n=1 Tax=Pareuzebyella sediminis TaxID=2607998 RepID=UPI0011EC9227|nr:FKBP-type peptidyl-prolyl cis-trans isomerase [Pareuzebyella sediminis]